jgi:hypothetical protein
VLIEELSQGLPSIIHIPSCELVQQIYLGFAATDRSHPSSHRAEWQVKIERLKMALARNKSRRVNAASVPVACEVCREKPVTTLVADFIFACDSCAKRIATALCCGRQERVVGGENFCSDREAKPVGLLISSHVRKRSAKGGIYEACKKNTFLPRGCHRYASGHRDEFWTVGSDENCGSKLYNGGQR